MSDLLRFRLDRAKDTVAHVAQTEGASREDRKDALIDLKNYCDWLLDEIDEEGTESE